MARKKKELTEAMLINWWLEKYHNTNIDEVQKLHPDWTWDNPDYNSRQFYETYPCTHAQHDEWYAWAIDAFAKFQGLGKKYAERGFCLIYLNTAPMVIDGTK
jgi:hypothetical protein